MSKATTVQEPDPFPTLIESLRESVADKSRVKTRSIDLHANANDASHFLLIPRAVVIAENAEEVGQILRAARNQRVGVTLRSGGTSLSGQAVTDGVLVDVRRNFTSIEILDDGARARVQPGVTVRALNARLARFGRKFGPDPASEIACTIGGVIANNSSGMSCGTDDNAYRTLESVVVVLPSGYVLDTATTDANQRLRELEPELFAGLERLLRRVRENPSSVEKIEQQYSMKNTMGYGLNAFLDFDTPVDVLAHLIVGSEGTLGFVAEATFRTIPLRKLAATTLLIFPNLAAANTSLSTIIASGAATIELMDALSLRVGQRGEDVPTQLRDLLVDQHAALLVEYQSTSADELADSVSSAQVIVDSLPLSSPALLSTDGGERAALWHLRKGLYATVAGARPLGTTALLEDIVVPVEALAQTCTSLINLFERHGYVDSVIFGHAKDGNVHFMLTDTFEGAESLDRFSAFTEDMVDLVLSVGGSLKAEHGTGRMMAPFVRRQFGDELYSIMQKVKMLCDPAGIMNPGVLLNEDETGHLQSFKMSVTVEEEVDRCVECGYCEPACPSRNLTLTPRQRIVLRRATASARANGEDVLADELERDQEYDSIQTCAVDGMCQTACPVSINTGSLVRRLREQDSNKAEQALWSKAADHWSAVTNVAGKALSTVAHLPIPLVQPINVLARRALGNDTIPLYSTELPGGGLSRSRPSPTGQPDAVYFPACVGAMFGPIEGSAGVQVSFEELCARANVVLSVPSNITELCCGTPWSSKGMKKGKDSMRERTLEALLLATRNGELPIVCDASSCTEGLLQTIADGDSQHRLVIIDAVEFVSRRVLPFLPEVERLESLALHPTCSSTRLGTNDALKEIADAVAETVLVPDAWGCCAFAGDRGMLHPELTEAATTVQAQEVRAMDAKAHASCNRTCELGMTRATGEPYAHVIELLATAVRQLPADKER